MLQKIDPKTIEKIARLAHLKLDDSAAFSDDLSAILHWMEQLDEVDVSGVAPLAHPMELAPVMREDEPAPPLAQDVALSAAPETQSGFFTTPKTNE